MARATGQAVRQVASESWALTLWTYLQVTEIEEIARVRSEGERIDLASLVAIGYHEPKELRNRDNDWRERASLVFTRSKEETLDRGRRMVERILATGVLDP